MAYKISPVVEKFLTPATARETPAPLDINVVFTSVDATLAALKQAGKLAHRLAARITLVVLQIVPYPLPLTSPPVSQDWNERRFRVIASQSPVETTIHLYLCRDRFETLLSVLKPGSLVVIGGRQRWWWPTRKRRSQELCGVPVTKLFSRERSKKDARFILCRRRLHNAVSFLGFYQGVRQALGDSMDYIIAGIASLGLFAYLIYALLRPEKF